MLVGDGTGFISDVVVYILKTAFSKELVTRTEWNLNDARQFCQVSSDDFLDVCDSLRYM